MRAIRCACSRCCATRTQKSPCTTIRPLLRHIDMAAAKLASFSSCTLQTRTFSDSSHGSTSTHGGFGLTRTGSRCPVPRSMGYHYRRSLGRHSVPQKQRIFVRERNPSGRQSATISYFSEQRALFHGLGVGFVAMGSWRGFSRPSFRGSVRDSKGSPRRPCQIPVGTRQRAGRLS